LPLRVSIIYINDELTKYKRVLYHIETLTVAIFLAVLAAGQVGEET
jgi:hypothetical protein